MNVAHQLQKIRILLAQNRFVAVLKQVACAAVPSIKTPRISAQKPAHNAGNGGISGPQQKMKMIGHQRPRVTRGLRLHQNFLDPFEKIAPVGVRPKDLPALNPPANYMVQCTWSVNAGFPRHKKTIAFIS
jgi:hypothetical protein